MLETRAAVLVAAALLAACDGGQASTGTEAPPDAAPPAPPTLLREVTDEVGVTCVHKMPPSGKFVIPETMASGCAVFDADGDGRPDLLFANAGKGPENGAPNVLYLQGADGRFEEVPGAAGLAGKGYTHGLAVGDVDNDGDLDVYEGNWGADALYLNDGTGHFTDVTARAGIVGDSQSSSVAFLDYDVDGFLDIYVVHYVVVDDKQECSGLDGHRDYCGPTAYQAVSDTLYRNRGDGTFEDVSAAAGIDGVAAAGLGVVVADFDDDGWPDVYVANDAAPNQLWTNARDGTFEEDAVILGAAVSAQGIAEASMGLAVGDVNGDLALDVFITHLDTETNTLYVRRGKAGFRDASASSGLAAASLPFTGFGTAFLDLDHDGDLDLVAVNGRVMRRAPLQGDAAWEAYAERNLVFLNDGTGHFDEVSDRAGKFGERIEVSRGLAASDLDGDGDLDLVMTNAQGRARVFENTVPDKGHWLRVRAFDAALRRDAYGAKVVVRAGGKAMVRFVAPAASYLSSAQADPHFGLGAATRVEAIDVVWPGGEQERFTADGVDRRVEVVRGKGVRR